MFTKLKINLKGTSIWTKKERIFSLPTGPKALIFPEKTIKTSEKCTKKKKLKKKGLKTLKKKHTVQPEHSVALQEIMG